MDKNDDEYTPIRTNTDDLVVDDDQFHDEKQATTPSSQMHQQWQNRNGNGNNRTVAYSKVDNSHGSNSMMDEQLGELERKIHEKIQQATTSPQRQSRLGVGQLYPSAEATTIPSLNDNTMDHRSNKESQQLQSLEDRIQAKMQANQDLLTISNNRSGTNSNTSSTRVGVSQATNASDTKLNSKLASSSQDLHHPNDDRRAIAMATLDDKILNKLSSSNAPPNNNDNNNSNNNTYSNNKQIYNEEANMKRIILKKSGSGSYESDSNNNNGKVVVTTAKVMGDETSSEFLDKKVRPEQALPPLLKDNDTYNNDGMTKGKMTDESLAFSADKSYDEKNGGGKDYSESLIADTTSTELAVARPVLEDEYEDTMLPAAIEFDPDQKHAELINSQRRRRRKVICWMLFIIIISVSIATGVVVSKNKNASDVGADPKLVSVQDFIKANLPKVTTKVLLDRTNPYAKAINWMVYVDPQQLDPAVNGTFLQRFYLAYLYYATSIKHEWDFCYPINATNGTDSPIGQTKKQNGQFTCREVLWSKFQGVYGPTFNPNPWLSHKDECVWAGINCDTNGHVIDIITIGAGVNGNFPEHTHLLPFLSSIQVGSGNLTGTLPSIAYKTLLNFMASDNQLTGSIPTELIRDSRMLMRFQVALNTFTGIELGNVTKNIKTLGIDGTDYGRTLDSDDIDRLSSLFYFDASNCNIKGKIPPVLLNKPYMTVVEMTNNQLTGTIPNLDTPYISRILLGKNQLTGPIPDSLYDQTSLTTLLLSDNRLNGTISTKLQNISDIGELSLDKNLFWGTLPPIFGELSSMTQFTIVGTNINGTIPVELCNQRSAFLDQLDADCLIDDSTGVADISCSPDCCTSCCDHNGANCVANPN